MTPSTPGNRLPVRIERMTAADLEAVLAIEEASFTSPWLRQTFLDELHDNRVAHLFVARVIEGVNRDAVVGYTCVWTVVDEIHIINFAVHPDVRRQYVGQQLLAAVMRWACEFGCRQGVLEVRASNRGAQRLYAQFGFAPVAVRKGYYSDNQEDAIIMFVDDIPTHVRRLSASSA
jgi:[ribosomal protein S18]-alanine N-acetyltransferase